MERNCQLCKLGCGKAVPGKGSKSPLLIVLSDQPGKKESETGRPMEGGGGQLLRAALKNIVKLDLESEVYFDYVIRCEPKEGVTVGKSELAACRRWTDRMLKEVNGDLILVAGGLAFESLLPLYIEQEKAADKDFNLSRAHGRVLQQMGKTYMLTWNPNMVAQHKFKRRVGGTDARPLFEDWYPTGSVPWLFKQDMVKLKELVDAKRAAYYGDE